MRERHRSAVLRRLLTALAEPTALTVGLTALLGGVGVALAALLPTGSTLLPGPHGPALLVVVVALCAALVASEFGQAHVEIRQQTYSFSLTGAPLLLGLLYLPPLLVLGARVVAALVAFRLQRSAPVKTAYNTAAYLLDTALVAALLHAFVTPAADLGVRTALTAYVSLAVVDLLMTALVLLVIRINVGPLELSDVRESFVPAGVIVAAASTVGLLCTVLIEAGSLGWVLLVVVGTGTGAAYRAYLVLRRRHGSLQLVQGFIDRSVSADSPDALAAELLGRVRELLVAHSAHLVVRTEAGELRVLARGEHDAGATDPGPAPLPPFTVDGLVPSGTPDPGERAWLAATGSREALVVDLDRFGMDGVLVATDRLGGEISHFSADDLSLAQALAGHLVVALRNTQLVDRLRWEATHDPLTRLPNRRVLLSALEAALDRTGSGGRAPAVLVLGLDRFAEVKETLGHAIGDLLLVEVASRLAALPLPGATVARLGGDEFAVLVPDARELPVEEVTAQLLGVLERPVRLADALVSAGASVGVADNQDGADAAEMLRRADTALYAARAAGLRRASYERSIDSGRAERLALLGDLHRALDDGQLDVHYQPKLDLRSGRVRGVEALVRWEHPTLGPVSPAVFVALAESTGLVDRLTDLVLSVALERNRAWSEDGLDLVVAVNLSTRSLEDPTLPERIRAHLEAAGVPAGRLVLEITETSLMGDPERTLPVLQGLADLGVGLSLDDFGTGYSSLAYLQRLPVHELKIDRSFVTALEDPSAGGSVALISSILGLAGSLGLHVVAEGVESARAMGILRDLGCELVQGYLVSRPVPAAAVPGVVRAVEADPVLGTRVPGPRTYRAAAPAVGA